MKVAANLLFSVLAALFGLLAFFSLSGHPVFACAFMVFAAVSVFFALVCS